MKRARKSNRRGRRYQLPALKVNDGRPRYVGHVIVEWLGENHGALAVPRNLKQLARASKVQRKQLQRDLIAWTVSPRTLGKILCCLPGTAENRHWVHRMSRAYLRDACAELAHEHASLATGGRAADWRHVLKAQVERLEKALAAEAVNPLQVRFS